MSHAASVPGFRYAQFCPVARAAEIVGERWTLLAVRELLFGPQRFSDLRTGLSDVSSSVLTERLARLEERGLVSRRRLPPPASSTVYELTDLGRGLRPVIAELARWGAGLLGPPEPGERLTPRALRLGLQLLSRRGPAPERRYALCASDGESEERFGVAGGADGTRVGSDEDPVDARISGPPFALASLAAGILDPAGALRDGTVRVEGDPAALADLPRLFDFASRGPQGTEEPGTKGT